MIISEICRGNERPQNQKFKLTVLFINILQEKNPETYYFKIANILLTLCVTSLVTWVSYHGSVPYNYPPRPPGNQEFLDRGSSWQEGLLSEEGFGGS